MEEARELIAKIQNFAIVNQLGSVNYRFDSFRWHFQLEVAQNDRVVIQLSGGLDPVPEGA